MLCYKEPKKDFDTKSSKITSSKTVQARVSTADIIQKKKKNNTGIPNDLKDRVENLSGMDLSEVRVRYNSDKPAQIGAFAYTQGTDIHVAPGQERYLPHETWHVVQQAQGRVRPTMQMKGFAVNDDVRLEKEADEISEKQVNMSCLSDNNVQKNKPSFSSNKIVQRYPVVMKHGVIIETKDRPCKRTTVPVIKAMVSDIFTNGAKNPFEEKLYNIGNEDDAVEALHKKKWLSTNGAAVCHKDAIKDVERVMVQYGNMILKKKSPNPNDYKTWIMALTARNKSTQKKAVTLLNIIQNSAIYANPLKSQGEIICEAINTLIELVDASSTNYYIGDTNTNSALHDHPDPHFDILSSTDKAPLTPRSKKIFDARKDIAASGGLRFTEPPTATDKDGIWTLNSGASGSVLGSL